MQKIVYIFVLLSFIGCETTLSDFELEEKPPKQVINAFIGNDSLAMIHVSRSSGILESDMVSFINNSSLTVMQNGNQLTNFNHVNNGTYRAEAMFQLPSGEYNLEANHPSLPPATARFSFPEKAEILEVDTNWFRAGYDPETDWYENEYLRLNIKVEDPNPGKSYFLVQVIRDYYNYILNDTNEKTDSILLKDPIYIESSSSSAQLSLSDTWVYRRSSEDEQYISGYGIVFTDELISGDIINLPVETGLWELLYDGTKELVDITISVKHISHDYYLFLNSYAIYDEAQYNPFAQNVNVFSNIEGGFGIVATYTKTNEFLPVKIRIPKIDY